MSTTPTPRTDATRLGDIYVLTEKLETELAVMTRERDELKELIPITFYSDRTTKERFTFLIAQWNKLVPLCEKLDADKATLVEALKNIAKHSLGLQMLVAQEALQKVGVKLE